MPADGPAVSDDSHISFAKRLAHNNKDTRESALKKVKRWLVTKSKQGTLDHDEIIKIWKGLHYSMWYSDKPLTQQTLALDISQIVSLLPDIDDGISFFGGFCETIAREWVGIDRHRLDKFYMFIKTALKCVIEFCKENNWDDTIVSNVVDTLDIRIINSQSPCPDSISVFISEHLYSIYSAICNDSTSPLFITEMLLCYVTALSKTPKKDLSRVIMENLFSPIISKSVSFKVDHEQLTSFITTIAIQPDILTRNRKLLYKLRNDIATAGGVDLSSSSPLGKHKLENEDDVKVANDENVSSNSLADVGDEVKQPKKKKKKKVKQAVEGSETIVDIAEETGAEKVEEVAASGMADPEDQDEKEAIPVIEPEPESATVEVDQNNTEDVKEDEPMEIETNVSEPDSVVIPVPEVELAAPAVEEEAPVVSNGGVEDEVADDSPINDAAVITEQVVDDDKEVVDDTVAKEIDSKTSEEDQETVVEDDTKDDSNDTGGDVMAVDEKEESVEQSVDLTDETVIASAVMDTKDEIESSLPKPELEVPAKKAEKRKSTKSKKTPKKQPLEPAEPAENEVTVELEQPSKENGKEVPLTSDKTPAKKAEKRKSTKGKKTPKKQPLEPAEPAENEVTVELEQPSEENGQEVPLTSDKTPAKKAEKRKSTKGKKTPKKQPLEPAEPAEPAETADNEITVELEQPLEENGQEVALPSDETGAVSPSPRRTRTAASLRKRKKKSICQTPTPEESPSTPIAATPSTKKKVRLSMENNEMFFFKKNSSLESPKPFDSTRTPLKGVLKMSPALTRSQARKKGKSRVKP